MAALLTAGAMVALTTIVTMGRMHMLRWLGYASIVDVAFTAILLTLFAGTFSGIVAAAFSGLWMTAMLLILRRTLGCERLAVRRVSALRGGFRLYWKRYAPADLSWFGFRPTVAA